MVFTKLLLENAIAIRPCNYGAASEQTCPLHTSSLIALYRKVRRPCFEALFLNRADPWNAYDSISMSPSSLYGLGTALKFYKLQFFSLLIIAHYVRKSFMSRCKSLNFKIKSVTKA